MAKPLMYSAFWRVVQPQEKAHPDQLETRDRQAHDRTAVESRK